MTDLIIATEDALSEAVVERLVENENQGMCVTVRIGRKGNGYLKQRILEFIRTAHAIPVILMTDLDHVECAPVLIADWCGRHQLPKNMLFRVAVQEVEAWLLADREGFSNYSGVPVEKIPRNPESIDDPKQMLMRLIRRYGYRKIKVDVLPDRGSPAKIGLGYNRILSQFVRENWSPVRAAKNADSLARTCLRLHELGGKVSHESQ